MRKNMTINTSSISLGLETHPCASQITQTFFAELEHHRHSITATQQFFQDFKAVLRFMSVSQLWALRSTLVTPMELQWIDQELILRQK